MRRVKLVHHQLTDTETYVIQFISSIKQQRLLLPFKSPNIFFNPHFAGRRIPNTFLILGEGQS